MLSDYIYLVELLTLGDIHRLEEAELVLDDFPHGKDPYFQQHWIIHAIDHGCMAAIEWVLSKNVDLTFHDHCGYTPLLSTLERTTPDKYQILEQLITHGAPLNGQGLNDWTPLHMAAVQEDLTALGILLKHGADLGIRTRIDDYATPLEEAQNLQCFKAVEYLQRWARGS